MCVFDYPEGIPPLCGQGVFICMYCAYDHSSEVCVFDYLEGMPPLDGQGMFICMYCSDILVFYNAQC